MNKLSLAHLLDTCERDGEHWTPEYRQTLKAADAFCDMMTRTGVLARLLEQCGVYISLLSNEDREVVLGVALELAWQFSDDFNPGIQSLTMWWDRQLQCAMNTRESWVCWLKHGQVDVLTKDIPGLHDEF